MRVYGKHSETRFQSADRVAETQESVKMRVYGKPPETYANRYPKNTKFRL